MIARGLSTIALLATAAFAAPVTHWTAQMKGSMEVPANDSKGTGTATFTLKGNMLEYTLTAKGLSGPATAAHIHAGKVGVAGPAVFTFVIDPKTAAKGGTLSKGTIDLSKQVLPTVSGDSLKALILSGNAYVNVHTPSRQAGEIRGQLTAK